MNPQQAKYQFDDPHIIIAYHELDFLGVLITQPGETLTLKEITEFFAEGTGNPTYFMVEKLPKVEADRLTESNFRELLSEKIATYMQGGDYVFDKDVTNIPCTIH